MSDRIIMRTGEALVEAEQAWSAAEPEVIIGELDEGAVWEAVLDPNVGELGEIVWVVDLNRQSLDRVVPDIAAYDAFYKKLIAKINLTDVSSSFAMGQIKYTTALALEFVSVADDDK